MKQIHNNLVLVYKYLLCLNQEEELNHRFPLIEKLVKEEIQKIEDKEDSSLKIETNKGFKKK